MNEFNDVRWGMSRQTGGQTVCGCLNAIEQQLNPRNPICVCCQPRGVWVATVIASFVWEMRLWPALGCSFKRIVLERDEIERDDSVGEEH